MGDVELLGRRLDRPRDRRLVAVELGQPGTHVGARLGRVAAGGVGARRVAGLLDELLEAVAVTLQERGALRLTVIGEHDQPVRSRRLGGGLLDPADLAVDLLEHGIRNAAAQQNVAGTEGQSQKDGKGKNAFLFVLPL